MNSPEIIKLTIKYPNDKKITFEKGKKIFAGKTIIKQIKLLEQRVVIIHGPFNNASDFFFLGGEVIELEVI